MQTNVVDRTGASGYGHLARHAAFGSDVAVGRERVMVADVIDRGGAWRMCAAGSNGAAPTPSRMQG